MFLKILEVFTSEYRKETKYCEFMEKHIKCFKFKGECESVDEIVGRLNNFESNFAINISI